jgi:hypothetical protein
VQFRHELRRRDAEFEKLQKQLAARVGAPASSSRGRSVSRTGSSGGSTGGMQQMTGKLTITGRWVAGTAVV